MKYFLTCILLFIPTFCFAETPNNNVEIVYVPVVNRASQHHAYANYLLATALELSAEKYGPYLILRKIGHMPIQRQLQEIVKGDLSVAISMPTAKWEEQSQVVHFPLLKGLASYRIFFMLKETKAKVDKISTVNDLKTLAVGQGQGWSTGKILETHGFDVVYGSNYPGLFKMLKADRFQLLMRGVYEIEPELRAFSPVIPNLDVADKIAIYTYLPMYFCVSKHQPLLAERLEYGLKLAHKTGEIDKIFAHHFETALNLLNLQERKIFYLENTNISSTYMESDRPYLLKPLQAHDDKSPKKSPQKKAFLL